jgi:hypothetical protein
MKIDVCGRLKSDVTYFSISNGALKCQQGLKAQSFARLERHGFQADKVF